MRPDRRKGIAITAGIATTVAVAVLVSVIRSPGQPAKQNQVVAIIDARVAASTLIPGYICAGVQVSRDKILTAAHCVDQVPIDALRVVLGGPDLCAESAGMDLVHVNHVSVADPHTAPWKGDVAVLTFAMDRESAVFSDLGQRPSSGSAVRAYGWAGGSLSADSICIPRPVDLKVIADDQCAIALGDTSSRYDRSTSFCAVGVSANTCHGDSGGPVYSLANNSLVGIVSWGVGCQVRDIGVYALPSIR
jgi:secreted trypsin-like serine protease